MSFARYIIHGLLIVAFTAFVVCQPKPQDAEYKIVVAGTPGMPVTGWVNVWKADGTASTRPIPDTVPFEQAVSGNLVLAAVCKESPEGELRVTLLKNGSILSSSNTDIPYGMVSAASKQLYTRR